MALEYFIQPNPLTDDPDDFRAQIANARYYNDDEITERILKKSTTLGRGALNEAFGLWRETVGEILAEGDGIDTKAVIIHLGIKGKFNSAGESKDMSIHPSVHFGTEFQKALTQVKAHRIHAPQTGTVIESVTDIKTQAVNRLLSPGGAARITGDKVKLAGDDPSVGLYFINIDTGARTKVDASSVAENTKGHLMVVIPPLAQGTYHIEVVTQFTGGGVLSKTPKTATFDKPLTVT